MSVIPQGAFLTAKVRQNKNRKTNTKKDAYDNFYEITRNTELNPLQYNSKMMNSIWGLYNRYSVHNLKKNIDKNMAFNVVNQQMISVGSAQNTTNTTTTPVFTGPWDLKLPAAFGNSH